MSEEKKNNGWGGRRKGAGRRPAAQDGTERKQRSLRASDAEWELIKKLAKVVKDDATRAEKILKEFESEQK